MSFKSLVLIFFLNNDKKKYSVIINLLVNNIKRKSDNSMNETVKKIRQDFINSSKALQAIGYETRQHIILALMESPCDVGMRVGEITKKTHLSRPAVSHHLKILKEAEIVNLRKEKTMNFYSINVNGGLQNLIKLSEDLKEYSSRLSLNSKED